MCAVTHLQEIRILITVLLFSWHGFWILDFVEKEKKGEEGKKRRNFGLKTKNNCLQVLRNVNTPKSKVIQPPYHEHTAHIFKSNTVQAFEGEWVLFYAGKSTPPFEILCGGKE